jgi:hypothetical protein
MFKPDFIEFGTQNDSNNQLRMGRVDKPAIPLITDEECAGKECAGKECAGGRLAIDCSVTFHPNQLGFDPQARWLTPLSC